MHTLLPYHYVFLTLVCVAAAIVGGHMFIAGGTYSFEDGDILARGKRRLTSSAEGISDVEA